MLLTLSAFLTVSGSRNRTGQSWCLKWRCQGLCIHHLLILWPPLAPLISLHLFLFFLSSLSTHAWGRVAARRTWWHLSWQQLSASPINYTNWLTPFYSASGNFYHYRHNVLLDMLHAAVLNGGYALSPRVQTKSHIKKSPQRENSTDPSFARSHLDPPEETSSGVQFQRRDVWSGEGLD